jgi:hypothetical protein
MVQGAHGDFHIAPKMVPGFVIGHSRCGCRRDSYDPRGLCSFCRMLNLDHAYSSLASMKSHTGYHHVTARFCLIYAILMCLL